MCGNAAVCWLWFRSRHPSEKERICFSPVSLPGGKINELHFEPNRNVELCRGFAFLTCTDLYTTHVSVFVLTSGEN